MPNHSNMFVYLLQREVRMQHSQSEYFSYFSLNFSDLSRDPKILTKRSKYKIGLN